MTHTNKPTELYLNHWFLSCPKVLKVCLPNWKVMTHEQKANAYANPSPEFIAADRKFLAESERANIGGF